MTTATMVPAGGSLSVLLRSLKLPTFAALHEELADKAEQEGWSFTQYLRHLAMLELEERRRRRIARNLKASALPGEKTLATLDKQRLPAAAAKRLPTLCEGSFVDRGDNVLIFGLPGRGKTHFACALGHELVRRGRRVLFIPTYALVQRLLAAKRELTLEKELAHLDRFDAVILDDIGYVQQNRDEMEVLFTFLAQRYHGYPQPDEDVFGYRQATYDLVDWCDRCGVGMKQVAPFQMRGEPKWGKRSILQLNWVFDEYFVTPEAWALVFKPHGIECRPVLNTKGSELKSVVQLVAQGEVRVVTAGLSTEEGACSSCGRTKYLPVARGGFPALKEEPATPMVKTTEYFGSGASAHNRVLVSQPVARSLTAGKLRGASLRPVAERGTER